ncbi:L,D-transpeptidase family protein [Parasphingopyxis sp.]|uniref:L,D-transpeptidase family protein n=1 Tax=Parasphingopyxis sp. TaxID=1920299 RepID=UPI0026088176|nr:L,D-transpeptidase family protein [Parasphingopyxis sp.]
MPAEARWLGPEDVVVTATSNGPIHPHRAALEAAYGAETNMARRAIIATNLDRWRDLPARLGRRYLLVNVPAQEVVLWENGMPVQRWRAIVGRARTPTVSFSTEVTGVNLNPWWYIPQSIVRESVGRLVRTNPAEARRRGYVVSGGSYRQRPGPSNALGRMKLVMPNRHAIYLHDTPQRHLFAETERTFSHGCIRVQDAMDFAATLAGMTRTELEAMAANGETRTLQLAEPVPVHITYFTAVPGEAGELSYLDDIYGRDRS